MAHYTYKNVCFDVPRKYIDRFEKVHGREFDEDPNYNGDYWIVVGEWIKDLKSDRGNEPSGMTSEQMFPGR